MSTVFCGEYWRRNDVHRKWQILGIYFSDKYIFQPLTDMPLKPVELTSAEFWAGEKKQFSLLGNPVNPDISRKTMDLFCGGDEVRDVYLVIF